MHFKIFISFFCSLPFITLNLWSRPACLILYLFLFSIIVSFLDGQQWRRIRKTGQNHREKVQENKIFQVLPHLGCSSKEIKTLA